MARIKPQTLLLQSKKKKSPARISVTTIILCNLVVVLIILSFFATYRHLSQRSRNRTEEIDVSSFEGGDVFPGSNKYDLPSYAILNTSKGYITVELYKEGSPRVVDKFFDLCQKGYFKGMTVQRVIKHYVIEAGESQALGAAEDWILRAKPHTQSPKHEAFMLGTSWGKHATGGFELFITTAPIPDLSDKLSVFGKVVKGEDVVQDIEEVDTDEHYRPISDVGILGVTLKRNIW